ncbi:hypothetical protein BC833DRAFT_574622 [Globomyces pollinis-pini]|nr:hypothetical protein BC833DRAFT_574622 [Globomyces pollinis-pini]KAJ3000479.1 hypothetical protein HDV02_005344 [Globomyces sp. JEL0801]
MQEELSDLVLCEPEKNSESKQSFEEFLIKVNRFQQSIQQLKLIQSQLFHEMNILSTELTNLIDIVEPLEENHGIQVKMDLNQMIWGFTVNEQSFKKLLQSEIQIDKDIQVHKNRVKELIESYSFVASSLGNLITNSLSESNHSEDPNLPQQLEKIKAYTSFCDARTKLMEAEKTYQSSKLVWDDIQQERRVE